MKRVIYINVGLNNEGRQNACDSILMACSLMTTHEVYKHVGLHLTVNPNLHLTVNPNLKCVQLKLRYLSETKIIDER